MTPRIGCLWLERRAVSWLIAITVATVAPAGDACAQGSAPLAVRGPEGATASLPVDRSRGYAVVGWKALEGLGWAVESSESGLRATMADGGSVVEFAFGTPLFRWNGEVLQLVDVPFTKGGAGHVPLQFVLDFLPVRLGERYAFLPEEGVLEIRDAAVWAGLGVRRPDGPARQARGDHRSGTWRQGSGYDGSWRPAREGYRPGRRSCAGPGAPGRRKPGGPPHT